MSEGNLKNNKHQRKRAQNFLEAEKMILTDLILQYKDVIENKKSDAVTSKDKDKCWKTIEILFNSRSSAECRSSEVLRSCWDNLKKKQKFFADKKMQLYKTGGGPCESRSNTVLERIREIIKPSIDGLINTFDNDATGESISSCKVSTMSSRKYKITNSNTIGKMLNANDDVTDEGQYEDDVLNYLKKQNADSVEKDLLDDVLNIHETMDYNKENDYMDFNKDNYENESESDVNEDNLYHINRSKEKDEMQKQKQNLEGTSAVGILKANISTPLKKGFSEMKKM